MATSTANTTLTYSSTDIGTYAKLVDIISFPDMGSSPSKLDTTDLSALKYKTNILGLQEAPDLTFEANYDKATYATIAGLAGTTHFFKLNFGANGADGIFAWSGKVSVYVTGGGVDEVRKMQITISTETEIVVS